MTEKLTSSSEGLPPKATPEMVEAALHAIVPGGAEVWVWLPQQDAFTPAPVAREVMEVAINAALTTLHGRVGSLEASHRPYYTAVRKFTNSAGNPMELFVSIGSGPLGYCKLWMASPHSDTENITTWDELVQLQSALAEALGLPPARTTLTGEKG